MNWLTGRDLITVNVGGSVVNPSDLSITLQSGHGAYLPTGNFYLFFPGGLGELPEYIFVGSRATDVLTIVAPPLGNTGGNGRAALANTAPNSYGATTHPAGAVLQLRSTYEHVQQIQIQIDAHVHDGTTGNGPVLGTGAIANLAITAAKIANNTITNAQIASGTITNALMATDSVDTTQIKNDAVTTVKILNDAVTTAKILNDAVTTAKILNANVTTAKLAAGAVTGSVLGSDVVVLTGSQSITGTKSFSAINVTALTMAIGSDATNDMYYRGSGGSLVRLPAPSTAGHVLGHSSGVPAWGYGGVLDPTKSIPLYNLVTNGGMEVCQRSSTWGSGFSGIFLDRWTINPNALGTVGSLAREFSIVSSQSSASIKVTPTGVVTVGSDFVYMTQRIESAYQYAGITMTLAADMRCPAGGTLTMRAWDESAGGLGQVVATADGAWHRYSITFTMPTGHNVQARFDFGSNHTFYVDNVTMIPGTTAPWTPTPFGQELIECQRFYEVLGSSVVGTGLSMYFRGYALAGQGICDTHIFATKKYAAPSMTTTGTWNPTNCTTSAPTFPGVDDMCFSTQIIATATGDTIMNNFTPGARIIAEVAGP